MDGLKKVKQLQFLLNGSTLAQAAIQFILAEPAIASVLPNIYNESLLREFAAASDGPRLTDDELARVTQLYANNFGLEPQPAGTTS